VYHGDARFGAFRRFAIASLESQQVSFQIRSAFTLLTFGLLLASYAGQALAQRDLDEMFNRMRSLSVAGHNEAALAEARRLEAAFLARYNEQHFAYGAVLNSLGAVHQALGRYSEAEAYYRRVLALPKGAQWGALQNLAVVYELQGRHADAEKLYKKVIAQTSNNKTDSRGISSLGQTLSSLAHLYTVQGRYDEAEGLYKRVLVDDEKRFGKDHPDTAIGLGDLSNIYRQQGRLDLAEALAARALPIKERHSSRNPGNFSHALNDLGLIYLEQRRWADAETLFRRSLDIQERVLGQEDVAVAKTLQYLA
jgi:tetratricopeptide (TPR) repeat protein